jgi:DNA gyrase/topoisomerase IV subunit B
VYLNGELIEANTFEKYISLYTINHDSEIEDDDEDEKMIENIMNNNNKTKKQLKIDIQEAKLELQIQKEMIKKKRQTFSNDYIKTDNNIIFNVAFIPNFTRNRQFEHVSFVNGVYTRKGGTHVNYIMEKITKHLIPLIEKRNSKVYLI